MNTRLLYQAVSDVVPGMGGSVAFGGSAASSMAAGAKGHLISRAAKGLAGTGTPIPSLNGIAAHRATMAAVGGGPRYLGAGGIAGGMKRLDRAGRNATFAAAGVTSALVTFKVMLRYAELVRAEQGS